MSRLTISKRQSGSEISWWPCDAGRAGRNRGLIHNKDVLAGTFAALFGISARWNPVLNPVNPGTNNGIFDA